MIGEEGVGSVGVYRIPVWIDFVFLGNMMYDG